MSGSAQLDLVHAAIRTPIFGNIEWQAKAESRAREDPQVAKLTTAGIRALLRQHVLDGNLLEVRAETREEYKHEHPFWYRARITVKGIRDPLFVEVLLIDDNPQVPFVRIVGAHF